MQHRSTATGAAVALLFGGVALLLCGVAAGPADLGAQQPIRPLQPKPAGSGELPISPFMEGWYANEDGTYTISFGYLNRNDTTAVRIPVGEDNYLEPDRYDGMQPTIFAPGRNRGVFGVTIPSELRSDGLWWYITNLDGEVHKVPGRASAGAYELDRNPRPQGSIHPVVWFDGERGTGIDGVVAEEVVETSVGETVTLSISAMDPSERDPEDPRFREPVPLNVQWFPHQGPTTVVEFTRHESTVVPEPPLDDDGEPPPFYREPGPEEITLEEGEGTARVNVTFTEPGEYLLRARVDNFSAPDSSSGDQCCWTNGYVRVMVEP